MRLFLSLCLIVTLVSCGPSASSGLKADYYDGPGETKIVDNVDAFGEVGVMPANLSETQIQNIRILLKALTAGGLALTARHLNDKHILHSLQRELAIAEANSAFATSMVTKSELPQALELAEVKWHNLQTTLEQTQAQISVAKAKIAAADSIGRVTQLERTLGRLQEDVMLMEQRATRAFDIYTDLLAGNGVHPDKWVKSVRDTAAARTQGLRKQVIAEINRIPGISLRGTFRKIAFVGAVIVAVDVASHIIVLHALDVEPAIYPTAQLINIIGQGTYNWAMSKSDKYLEADEVNYVDLTQSN